jgi:hypothetical protein
VAPSLPCLRLRPVVGGDFDSVPFAGEGDLGGRFSVGRLEGGYGGGGNAVCVVEGDWWHVRSVGALTLPLRAVARMTRGNAGFMEPDLRDRGRQARRRVYGKFRGVLPEDRRGCLGRIQHKLRESKSSRDCVAERGRKSEVRCPSSVGEDCRGVIRAAGS